MEVVAPDMLDRYPFVEPPEFASGAIQTLSDPNFCIDTLSRPKDSPVGKLFNLLMATISQLVSIVYRTLLLWR